jgi:hypothetical protein
MPDMFGKPSPETVLIKSHIALPIKISRSDQSERPTAINATSPFRRSLTPCAGSYGYDHRITLKYEYVLSSAPRLTPR